MGHFETGSKVFMALKTPDKDTDRRRCKRYYAKDSTFAVLRTGPGKLEQIEKMSPGEIAMAIFKSKPAAMGQVIEISKRGLSFSFIDEGDIANEPLGIDLLKADEFFYIAHIPFKTIAEKSINNELVLTPISMRRRGIEFKNLTTEQKEKLEYFLSNHTKGEVTEDIRDQA